MRQGTYPSGAPFRFSPLAKALDLTRLEKLGKDKHFNLIRIFLNYSRKKVGVMVAVVATEVTIVVISKTVIASLLALDSWAK